MNRPNPSLPTAGLAGLALLLAFAPGTALQGPEAKSEAVQLPWDGVERSIAAGETHTRLIEVERNKALLILVDQRSIDLVIEARGPAGGEPITFEAGNDRWGSEVALLEAPGEYRIDVRPLKKSTWPGRYTIQTEDLPATGRRRDALALMSRAGQEAARDTPESRAQAMAAYRLALAAWRSLDERRWEAEALTCIALLEVATGELRTATEGFRTVLALWRALEEPRREAEAWNWLGVLHLNTQAAATAREPFENALGLWQRLGERFDEAETRNNLCQVEGKSGALSSVLDCYQENLAFFREHGVQEQEALVLNNLGYFHDLQGHPDAALACYQQALALRRELDDSNGQAETLTNMGSVRRSLGEMQEALRLYREAWDLVPSDDTVLQTRLLNNIGYAYDSLGEPERAVPYYEEVGRRLHESGNLSGEITSLNNLGSSWRKLADLKRALELHRQALGLATTGADTAQQATSRQRLAEVHLDEGDAAAALRELDAALELRRATGPPRAETELLYLRGRTLILAGRAQDALPVLQEVLARRRAVRDPVGEAETLYSLATAERTLGLDADARSHAQAAVDRAEVLRLGFTSPDLRASFLATRQRAFALLTDLLMDRHAAEPDCGHDREAFAVSERARARSLLDALRGATAVPAGSTAPAELLARRRVLLRRQSDKVDQRWKLNGDDEKCAALEKEIDAILAEVEAVEAEIRRHDPRTTAASASARPAGPEEISGWLEPGTMLLEYSLGERRSFLFTLEGRQLRSYVLPGRREIEALARRFHGELSTVEAGGARPEEAADSLARILLGPIWTDAARLHRLVVVPDGALGILPFAALPVPQPGVAWTATASRQSLLEHLEVVSTPSATTLGAQRQRSRQHGPPKKWAAVLADPVFAAADPQLARGSATQPSIQAFEPLPATRREAKAIADLAPPGQVWIGLGPAASREAVLSGVLHDHRILHFATHAVADIRNPELSGLALSQVDTEGRPVQGFLNLSDIYELDLDIDLVVLSACRTALGKEIRGEGLMGLTRGFQYAGAPRVVASLWRVPDSTTAELMTRFYQAMWHGDHLPPAAALRQAQRSLRSERRYSDPYSWAGFVLQGDWR